MSYHYLNLNEEQKKHYAGLQTIPEKQTILPITTTGYQGRVNPHLYFYCYYHIDKGGVSPYIFADFNQPINFKHKLPAPELFWAFRGVKGTPFEKNPTTSVNDIALNNYIGLYD